MSAEENKALVLRFFEEFWNKKHLEAADEQLAANHVDHTTGTPLAMPPGPEAFKQFASAYFKAFPDLHFTIEDLIAEGDKVVTRWTSHGTHTGEWIGIPATGKSTGTTGVTITQMAGGKSIETWTTFDLLALLHQLGVIPSNG